MMIMTTSDTKGQSPRFIFFDSRERNEIYKKLYTTEQQRKAIQLKELLYDIYGCKPKVYLNFRKNYISIKVQEPNVFEKNRDEVQEFNKNLKKGWFKSETKTGVLYEFHIL